MFGFVARWFDHSLDALFEKDKVPGFSQSTARVGAVLLGGMLVLGTAGLIWNSGSKIEQPPYFIVQAGKKPMRLPVLSSPSLSMEKIASWSSRAVRDIFLFGFRDADERLAQSSVYFTDAAWADFRASIEDTELLTRIREERLLMSLTPLEEPRLVATGMAGGKRIIRVEVAVALTYIGGEKPVVQYQLLELFVMPVPTTEDPEGLAIARLRAYPYDPFTLRQ